MSFDMKYIAAICIACILAYTVIHVVSLQQESERMDRVASDVRFLLTTTTNNANSAHEAFKQIDKILVSHKQVIERHETNFAITAHQFGVVWQKINGTNK